ncbi:MAG: efflux transporter outer membrane subunit [Paraperlucidibaca sp.]
MSIRITILLTSALMASGCSMLAPNYERPLLPIASQWPAALNDTTSSDGRAISQWPWQHVVLEPRLQAVITLALANNRDARIAALQVTRARAVYGVGRSQLFPSIDITGTSTNSRLSPSSRSIGAGGTSGGGIYRQQQVGIGISNFELDVFGRLSNLSDSAREQFLASSDTQRSIALSLISEVASAWLTLAADAEQLSLSEQTQQARQQAFDLVSQRVNAGVGSRLDSTAAESSLHIAIASTAELRALVAQDKNALSLLLGTHLPAELTPTQLPSKATIDTLPGGIPAEVLVARPDVMAAEHLLKARYADIGAARAAFFPSISLTASTGSASTELSGLFGGGTRVWSFAPQIRIPLFAAGRNLANLRISQADRDIAVAQYEKTVQTAFREVADALATLSTRDEQLNARRAITKANDERLTLAQARFDAGLDNYLSLLDSQREAFSSAQDRIRAELAHQAAIITLYKALGGGTAAPPPAQMPAPTGDAPHP